MTRIRFEGIDLVADVSGGLFLPDAGTLVVADLHFEKGSAFAMRGIPLPPYDSAATLARLEEAAARLRPRRIVALGDAFHDADGASRLGPAAGARLRRLMEGAEWLWILGNHDPRPPEDFPAVTAEEWGLAPLVFRHEPEAGAAPGEVAGHLHPKAHVSVRGRRVAARCFVSDGRRLVLPAFGAYAGGLDVFDPAIAGLFPEGFHAYMIGRDGVHAIADRRLTPWAGR